MEPFVAEQEERISNNPAAIRHQHQNKSPTFLVLLLVVVILIVSIALVALLYIQQRSFDSLQSNFMSLQSRLDGPTVPSPTETTPQKAVEKKTLETPQPMIVDLTAVEDKIASLENSLGNLTTGLANMETRISASRQSTAGSPAEIKALSATTAGLSRDIKALRDEILGIKFSLSDIEANKMSVDEQLNRRLNSLEQAVISLNEYRLNAENTSSDNTDKAALNRIFRELELLKKQHPYLKD